MSTGDWIVIGVVLALLLLALGGRAANARRRRATESRFAASLATVDRALAAALAQDRGWERSGLEAAARRELPVLEPGAEAAEVELVQIVDRPGTDEDQAIFVITTVKGERRTLTLGRRGDQWFGADLAR